jgi:hypothetical protein
MDVKSIDVTSIFKPGGEDLRVLVLHSTEDALGQQTVALLQSHLRKGVVVTQHRISSLHDLCKMGRPTSNPHVVLLIAHGDKATNQVWLFGDVDKNGNEIGTGVGIIKEAMDGLLCDVLCLFGICYFGSDFIQDAIINHAEALACIAPAPDYTITNIDIGCEFARLLNEMQTNRQVEYGLHNLQNLMNKTLSGGLHEKLKMFS